MRKIEEEVDWKRTSQVGKTYYVKDLLSCKICVCLKCFEMISVIFVSLHANSFPFILVCNLCQYSPVQSRNTANWHCGFALHAVDPRGSTLPILHEVLA